MAQNYDMADIYARIGKHTGWGRDDIDLKVDALMKQFPNGDGGSLLTHVGAALIICNDLGLKATDPLPPPAPVAVKHEPIMKNGAPELCQYCGSKKSWGVKVMTKNGKNAPGHITNDGQALVTVVDGKTYTGECPNFIKGAPKGSPDGASAGTIFDSGKPSYPRVDVQTGQKQLMDPAELDRKIEASLQPTPAPATADDELLALLNDPAPVPATTPKVEAAAKKAITAKDVIDAGKVSATTPKEAAAVPLTSAGLPPARGIVEVVPIFDTCGICGVKIPPAVGGGFCPQHEAEFGDRKVQPTTPNTSSCQAPTAGSLPRRFDEGGNVVVAPAARSPDLEGPLIGINDKLGTIGTIIAGFKVIIEQQAVVNTTAIAKLEEQLELAEGVFSGVNRSLQELTARVDALETVKPPRNRAKSKAPAPEEKTT